MTLSRSGLRFRPATLDDAALEARLETALYPDEPVDPARIRHWWTSTEPGWTDERWVVEDDGRAVGTAFMDHAPWAKMPDRFARVTADAFPEVRTGGRVNAMFDVVEERARGDGARTLVCGTREDDRFRQHVLEERGYREVRRSRGWELDLETNRERLLAMLTESREKMRGEGIDLHTLDRDDDPDKLPKLHRMAAEAEADVPTTVPRVDYSLERFRRWLESPGLRPDRIWIARQGDDLVGISMLYYPRIGNVWTSFTGTARAIRGRGVARALKLETVAQAMELGVRLVRTSNDGQNAPILHLNERMGYTPIAGWIQYHRASY